MQLIHEAADVHLAETQLRPALTVGKRRDVAILVGRVDRLDVCPAHAVQPQDDDAGHSCKPREREPGRAVGKHSSNRHERSQQSHGPPSLKNVHATHPLEAAQVWHVSNVLSQHGLRARPTASGTSARGYGHIRMVRGGPLQPYARQPSEAHFRSK